MQPGLLPAQRAENAAVMPAGDTGCMVAIAERRKTLRRVRTTMNE